MRTLLIVRGIIGFWFAIRFLGNPPGHWGGMFAVLSDYLVMDGVIGFAIAATLFRQGVGEHKPHLGSLGAVLLIDAVGRTTSGMALNIWPGIAGFPVTAVLFIALMAVFTAMLGVVEVGLIAEEDVARFGRRHARAQFSIPPVLLSSIASVGFGAAALFYAGDLPVLRLLLSGYVASAGLGMMAMAWSRRARPGQRPP